MLELKKTDHNYYCSETNYYVGGNDNHGKCEFDTWEDFKTGWLGADLSMDDDLNHCFRFDISENDEGKHGLWLFFILQRKGIFRPVQIRLITEKDMPEINEFLSKRFGYLIKQWAEFAK